VPITLAFLLCFVLSPLVALLRRIRLGRILSVVVSVVVALGLKVRQIDRRDHERRSPSATV